MWFHWKDGWFFSRQDNGSVTIEKRVYGEEKNELGEKMYTYAAKDNIPADEWASIVAAVSALGEAEGRWQHAKAFHAGEV